MQGEFERNRYRYKRRDYTMSPPKQATPPPQANNTPEEPSKPKSKTTRKKRGIKKLLLSIFIIVIAAGASAGGWWYLKNKDNGPIPKAIRQSVSFPLYYPSALPPGYHLDKNSIKNARGIVFFKLNSTSSTINISEQAAPANPPDFDALQKFNASFKKLDVLGGRAIYGTSQDVPVAFLITNTTLVNINGTKKTPVDLIAKLTQNMTSSF